MAVQIYVPGVVQLVKIVGLYLLVSYKLCFIVGLGLIPYTRDGRSSYILALLLFRGSRRPFRFVPAPSELMRPPPSLSVSCSSESPCRFGFDVPRNVPAASDLRPFRFVALLPVCVSVTSVTG